MWVPYLITGAALIFLGFMGMKVSDTGLWYQNLRKPKWNPPNWAFRLVWRTLYVSIFFAVGIAWNRATDSQQTTLFWVTAVNFMLNGLWCFVFFRWRLLGWTLVETVLLWLSIAAMILVVFPYSALSGWLLFPYLAWVTLSCLLSTSILLKNPTDRALAS